MNTRIRDLEGRLELKESEGDTLLRNMDNKVQEMNMKVDNIK